MSARLAAGCAWSSFQSVSVVPTIQCVPHGMTNSTDFSVRRIRPVSELIRSRGDDDVHALGRAHVEAAAAAGHRLDVVGPHTGAVDDDRGPDLDCVAGLDVAHPGADDPLAGAQQLDDLGGVDARWRRTSRRCGPPSGCGGRRRPARRSTAARRSARRACRAGQLAQRAAAGQCLWRGHRPRAAHRVVQRQAGGDVGALPDAVRQRVEERAPA